MSAPTQIHRFLISVVATLFLAAQPVFSQELRGELVQAEQNPVRLTDVETSRLSDLQFILVDGIFGEFFQSNFDPAVDVIRREWAGAEVTVIRPLTRNSIPTNSEILYQEIKDDRQASQKKNAVIVAHSKGAAEVALMALNHVDLVSEYGVIAYGLVSGPMGGTDIINFVTSPCETNLLICQILETKLPLLATFSPPLIQPVFSEAIARLNSSDKALFQSSVYFVRTQMTDYDVISPLYATHLYLSLNEFEFQNDGLIPTGSEILFDTKVNGSRVLGTDLGIMIGDHNSLLNKGLIESSRQYRETFFKTLVERMVFGSAIFQN